MNRIKKGIALLMAAALTFCVLPHITGFAADQTQETIGDMTGDGYITADDALEVLKCAAKLIEAGNLERTADTNADGSITAEDALLVLQYAAGLTDSFPAQQEQVTPTPEPTATPEVTPAPNPRLWIIGDSIAAYHAKDGYERPLYGWGEILPKYYSKDLKINNWAVSSQSSKSYLNEPNYRIAYAKMVPEDYVIISFGHNDHNSTGGTSRLTDPYGGSDEEGSFKYYLKHYYIDPALEKGVTPILMTAVVRCFYSNGVFEEEDIHLEYGRAMRELVEEYAAEGITVYLIDAQTYTYNLYASLTEEEAMLYHGLGQPSWKEWYKDTTHYSEKGARMITDFIVSELDKMPLSLNQYRIQDTDAQ